MSRIALDGNKTVYAYQEGRLEKKDICIIVKTLNVQLY